MEKTLALMAAEVYAAFYKDSQSYYKDEDWEVEHMVKKSVNVSMKILNEVHKNLPDDERG